MTRTLIAALLLAGTAATPALAKERRPAPPPEPRAKNVILFIGDGMGISTITAARIYDGQKRGETGEENQLSFERFPNVALVKTYNTNAQVPDSAGTATAMHSGVKTRIGVLGIGPEAEKGVCRDALAHPLPLLGEEVKKRGLALGIVTTTRITHATPASVYSRSADRDWESDVAIPADQQGQGCKDIALQLAETKFDVALGAARQSSTARTRTAPVAGSKRAPICPHTGPRRTAGRWSRPPPSLPPRRWTGRCWGCSTPAISPSWPTAKRIPPNRPSPT